MIKDTKKQAKRAARARRIRAKISGTSTRPRLSVFRSLRSFSVQAIDDASGRTLASATLGDLGSKAKNTVGSAGKIGTLLAERLEKQKISEAVLDRSGYRYHGKVKALAEAIRENGLKI